MPVRGRAATTCASCCARASSDAELDESVRAIWTRRTDRYSDLRTAETTSRPKVEMSHIGG